MANYGNLSYTGLSGVDIKGSGGIRFPADNGFNGTLSIKESADQAFSWKLPHKTGTMPIMGTFVVHMPLNSGIVTALSTIVTVAGIRAEDAVVVQFNKGVSGAYNLINTAYTLISALPGNGNITLTYMTGGGGTAYLEQICSYLAMR